jgi:hypothetical protein
MRYRVWSGAVLLMLALAGCGTPPDTVVSHQTSDPVTPVQPSLWERLTNRQGQITGRFLMPDGSPAAGFAFDCKPLFALPEGRPAVGRISGPNGEFICGGPPGSYQIEVYGNNGDGIIGGQQVEIHARERTTMNLTIQP